MSEADVERTMGLLEVPPEKRYTEAEVASLVTEAWNQGFDAGMRGHSDLTAAQAEMRGERTPLPDVELFPRREW